jgi:hypothetical protein
MNQVARKDVEQAWERLCAMNEEQTETLVKQFMEEQPALGIYLFASGETLEAGSLQESPLVDLVIASWQVLSRAAGRRLNQVTPEQIESAEEANTKALEQLENASEIEQQKTVQQTFENCPQRELLGFGVEILMSGHEENPELAPESIGMELLWLGTVIDCLDRQGKTLTSDPAGH